MGFMVFAILANDFILDRMKHGQRLVRFLGRITFPLYLIHNTVVFSFVAIFSSSLGVYSILLGFVGAYAAACLIEAGPETVLRRVLSRTPLLAKRPELTLVADPLVSADVAVRQR